MTDIISFTQAEGVPLFPVQKVILKAIYGIPLDDVATFTVTDWRRENPRQFTERAYLEYLYSTGHSSIREVVPGHLYQEVVLCAGLRSGKDSMIASLAAYEVLRLTSMDRNVDKSRIPPGVGITLVSSDNIEGLRGNVEMVFRGSPSLQGKSCPGPGGLWFGVPGPRDTPLVKVIFRRGTKVWKASSSGLVVLDDAAFCANARDIYFALAPATVGCIPGGKFVMVSAPNGREGFFYEEFMRGMTRHRDSVLSLQIPTWEINPTIPSEVFKTFHDADPVRFFEDYGAEWTVRGDTA